MLRVAGRRGDWREVLALHRQARGAAEQGPLDGSAALGLAYAGQWGRALEVISRFREQSSDEQFWSTRAEDISMCSIMLSINSRMGAWQEVLQTLEEAGTFSAVNPRDSAQAMNVLTKLGSCRLP